MNFDLSMDYTYWDNTVVARYEVARRNASAVDATPAYDGHTGAPATVPSRNKLLSISTAKRRNMTQRELAASGGAYTGQDLVWIVPAVLLPKQFVPKPADVIQEQDGTRWTVLEAGLGKNRNTWRLTCRDLVLANDLADTITIERPSISFDAAGVPVKAFPSDAIKGGVVLYSGLICRVQLITKEIADQRGIRGTEGKYEITVSQELDVTYEDRVLLASGLYLDIKSYKNGQRIDQLPVIEAERRV